MRNKMGYYISGSLWALLLMNIIIMIIFTPHEHTVTPNYFLAAIRWLHGEALYNGTGGGFIYFPQSAIFAIPFAILPFTLAEVLWRLLWMGLYIFSLSEISKIINPIKSGLVFLILTLATLPIAYASARNGQLNLMVVTFTLLAIKFLLVQRGFWAAFLLVLGFALKPLMIVPLLLIFSLTPEIRVKLIIWLLIILFFPFLTQSSHYVFKEYFAIGNLLHAVSNNGAQNSNWAQLYVLLKQVGVNFKEQTQLFLSALAALLTLIMCYLAKKKYEAPTFLLLLYVFSAIYLMLFNLRAENNSYIIIAPAIGYFIYLAVMEKKPSQVILLSGLIIGITAGHFVSIHLTPNAEGWFSPLMILIFTVFVSIRLFQKRGVARRKSLNSAV